MDMKRPKFYLDKSGTYGEVRVVCDKLREIKGRNRLYVEVYFKGNKLLTANAEYMHLQMWASNTIEEMEILNEALIQLDNFRGLMLMMQNDQLFLIVDGQKVAFVSGMEFCMNNGDYFIAVPYTQSQREPKKKPRPGTFEYVVTAVTEDGYTIPDSNNGGNGSNDGEGYF